MEVPDSEDGELIYHFTYKLGNMEFTLEAIELNGNWIILGSHEQSTVPEDRQPNCMPPRAGPKHLYVFLSPYTWSPCQFPSPLPLPSCGSCSPNWASLPGFSGRGHACLVLQCLQWLYMLRWVGTQGGGFLFSEEKGKEAVWAGSRRSRLQLGCQVNK